MYPRPTGQPFNWSTIGALCARSDHPRFFGDGIDLVFDELELGFHGRDFPGELGILDDELLEKGEDGLVGIFGFHVSEKGCVRRNLATMARLRRRALFSPGGEGKGALRPMILSANTPWAQRALSPYGRCIRSLKDIRLLCPGPPQCQGKGSTRCCPCLIPE